VIKKIALSLILGLFCFACVFFARAYSKPARNGGVEQTNGTIRELTDSAIGGLDEIVDLQRQSVDGLTAILHTYEIESLRDYGELSTINRNISDVNQQYNVRYKDTVGQLYLLCKVLLEERNHYRDLYYGSDNGSIIHNNALSVKNE